MIRRSTWIIIAIFIILMGLTVYLGYVNRARLEVEPTPTLSVALLADLGETSIDSMKIDDLQGKVIELSRNQADEWVLTNPPAEMTDMAKVQDTILQLLTLAPNSKIEPAPESSATGLDFPQFIILVQTKEGRQIIIRVGKETAIQNGYYLRVDQGPVFVIDKYILDNFLGVLDSPPILVTPTSDASVTPEETPVFTETNTPVPESGNP